MNAIYACGPGSYNVPLAVTNGVVQTGEHYSSVCTCAKSVRPSIVGSCQSPTSQACYKPQLWAHEAGKEVGPMVDPSAMQGDCLATSHDEGGIQDAPRPVFVLSTMKLGWVSRRADCRMLAGVEWPVCEGGLVCRARRNA